MLVLIRFVYYDCSYTFYFKAVLLWFIFPRLPIIEVIGCIDMSRLFLTVYTVFEFYRGAPRFYPVFY